MKYLSISILLLFSIVSCKKEATQSELTALKLEGEWKLYSYFLKGIEDTPYTNDSTYIYPEDSEVLSFTNIRGVKGDFKRTPERYPGFSSTFIVKAESAIEITEDTDYASLYEFKLTNNELIIMPVGNFTSS